jgi:hypothetical protein
MLDLNTIILATIAVVPATIAALRSQRNGRKLEKMGQQFEPNGGDSLRDQANRLEQNLNAHIVESREHLTRQDAAMDQGAGRLARIEHRVERGDERFEAIEVRLEQVEEKLAPDSGFQVALPPPTAGVATLVAMSERGPAAPSRQPP